MGVGRYRPYAPAYKRPSWPRSRDVGVSLTSFQSGHGWAYAGGGTSADDTTTAGTGIRSARLDSGGAGATKTLTQAAFTAVDLSKLIPRVKNRISAVGHIATNRWYIGSNSTDRYYWDLFYNQSPDFMPVGYWKDWTLPWSDVHVTGAPNRQSISYAQYRIVDDAAGSFSGWADLVQWQPRPTKWPTGVVTWFHDDGSDTAWTYRDYYKAAGVRLMLSIIWTALDSPGYLTSRQLQTLVWDYGFEVAHHAYNQLAFHEGANGWVTGAGGSADALRADFEQGLARAAILGIPTPRVAVYPQGWCWNNTDATANFVLDTTRQYFEAARSSIQGGETLPPGDPHHLRARCYLGTGPGYNSPAQAKTFLQTASSEAEHIIYINHKAQPTAPGNGTTLIETDLFQALNDYVASGVPYATMSEILDS